MSYFFLPGVAQQLDVTTIVRVSADNHRAYIHTDDGDVIPTLADFDEVVEAFAACFNVNF